MDIAKQCIVTTTTSGDVAAYEYPSGRELFQTSIKGSADRVAQRPGSSQVAFACKDGVVRIFDLEKITLDPVVLLVSQGEWVNDVKYSPTGDLLAASCNDNSIHIYDARNNECTFVLKMHVDRVRDLAFSHDSTMLVSASADGNAIVWRLFPDPNHGHHLLGHNDLVYTCAVSNLHGNTVVVTGGRMDILSFWNQSADGSFPAAREWKVPSGLCINKVLYNFEETLLAVACGFRNSEGMVYVFKTDGAAEPILRVPFAEPCVDLSFSIADDTLITAHGSATSVVPIDDGKRRPILTRSGNCYGCSFVEYVVKADPVPLIDRHKWIVLDAPEDYQVEEAAPEGADPLGENTPFLPALTPPQQRVLSTVVAVRNLVGHGIAPRLDSKKFLGAPGTLETAVSLFVELMLNRGIRVDLVSMLPGDGQFVDAPDRAARTGFANFGALHQLASCGGAWRASFILRIHLDQSALSAVKSEDPTERSTFANKFRRDVASALHVEEGFIRVLGISASAPAEIKLDISSITRSHTTELADELVLQVQDPTSQIYKGHVTRSLVPQDDLVYEFTTAFTHMQLPLDLFDPSYNRDFGTSQYVLGQPPNEDRGSEPYYPPTGWFRHGLKVSNKYDNNRWLTMTNADGEWPVAFHGSTLASARAVVHTRILGGQADEFRREAARMNPASDVEQAVYVNPDVYVCDLDGAIPATQIWVMTPEGGLKAETFKVAFQCRIDKALRTQHKPWQGHPHSSLPQGNNSVYRMYSLNAVRPYGLLIKKLPNA
eukprot:m.338426 g.338426  ORF g.338426 m.338426 type:complete len:771 (+) comp55733_c0_seq6:48-2360(+)